MSLAQAMPPIARQSKPVTSSEPSGEHSTTPPLQGQSVGQVGLLHRPDVDARGGVSVDEFVGAGVGDDAALGDDEQVIGGLGHLAHQVAGEEHRAPLGGQALHQVSNPEDAVGVETVDRLIEDQRVGVAEQGRGDAEPLTHAEREGPDPLARHLAEPDDVEHCADPAAVDAVAVGEPGEMVGGATSTDDRLGVQQRPDRP